MFWASSRASSVLPGHRKATRFLCSASPCPSPSASSSFPDHISFIKNVGATQPPQHLSILLDMLSARGESILPPGDRKGLIPLAIPLSRNSSGIITALLRWPTAPPGMEMPVVKAHKNGVWLLAKNVSQFIHRILVEEDATNSQGCGSQLFKVAAGMEEMMYEKGDFAKSVIASTDDYLLRKVGLFPDVLERKVMHHLEEGDHVSALALVTGEFYARKRNFPGFARPFVFNAEVLLKVGRNREARDAARGALKSPWWTLGCKYEEVARVAEWEDDQIEYVTEKMTEEGRAKDLNRGKPPAQIALDEAAFLLDLASVEGTWNDHVEQIAECYKEAGLDDISRFVLYNG